jgi:molecular chaperone IbpA
MNKLTTGFFPEQFLKSYIGGLDLFEQSNSNYPPYNIEKVNEDEFILTLAVSGFKQSDLKAYVQNNRLIIEGKRESNNGQKTYVYRGMSLRDFRQEFILGENVDVVNISLDNGLLEIATERKIPESAKPKYFEIKDKNIVEVAIEKPALKVAK